MQVGGLALEGPRAEQVSRHSPCRFHHMNMAVYMKNFFSDAEFKDDFVLFPQKMYNAAGKRCVACLTTGTICTHLMVPPAACTMSHIGPTFGCMRKPSLKRL